MTSFVKGWGSNYSRTHILSCECWFEIQLLECLSWLDHVLSNMAPPGMLELIYLSSNISFNFSKKFPNLKFHPKSSNLIWFRSSLVKPTSTDTRRACKSENAKIGRRRKAKGSIEISTTTNLLRMEHRGDSTKWKTRSTSI